MSTLEKKVIRCETAYSTPWCELVAKTINTEPEPFYSLKLSDYVSVLPITPEGNIVVLRQFRPAVEGFTFELPSGLLDEGEQPLETARRELFEETGFREEKMVSLGQPMLPDTGRLGNRLWSYVARNVTQVESDTFSSDSSSKEEGIEVLIWTPLQLREAIQNGKFSHGLHLAVLFLAEFFGELRLNDQRS